MCSADTGGKERAAKLGVGRALNDRRAELEWLARIVCRACIALEGNWLVAQGDKLAAVTAAAHSAGAENPLLRKRA